MKTLTFLIAGLLTILTAGCGNNVASPDQSTNAALNYGNTLVNAKKTADKTIDISYLNQAIQLYNTQEGHYPRTLQDLVPNYVAKIPNAPLGYDLNYDATKGEVKVVPQ